MIIAVDFDGCLCEDRFPDIGEANTEVIDQLKEFQRMGDKLILWTCRKDERLADAVAWCAAWGLRFDAVNENLQYVIEAFGGDCRKIFANEYWDDRAVEVVAGSGGNYEVRNADNNSEG